MFDDGQTQQRRGIMRGEREIFVATAAIEIPEHLLQALRAHACDVYPHECCGALYGTQEGAVRRVRGIARIDNISQEDQRRRFSISARDYLRAEREAAERGLLLLGFYHSHPDHPALPSQTDRAYALPGFSYPIVSILDGYIDDIRSWRLADGDAWYEEEEVREVYCRG